jgi:hypothetical protein
VTIFPSLALPPSSTVGWNGCIDDELRQLLGDGADYQRIRHLVSPPKGHDMVRLPEEVAAEWQRVDEETTGFAT